MGKGALRPFFKGHSLKKEKEHEKKEVDKMLSHFVTLPFFYAGARPGGMNKHYFVLFFHIINMLFSHHQKTDKRIMYEHV